MTAIETKIKRWGNSFGIIIPREKLKDKNIQEGEEVIIEINKKEKLKDMFGSLKDWKIDTQKEKNKLRKEWKE